jgi:lipopolysaccharide export system permease protein
MLLPRYFVREVLKLSLAIIGGLFVVYLSLRVASSLGEAAEGKIAPQHILRLVGLKMLVSLKDLVPMALFLGTFATITRIQESSEWVAMRAAGLSHQRLLLPLLGVSAVAAVLVGIITLAVGPQAELSLRELKERTESEATIAGVKAGRFRELSGGRRVFYAESVSADRQHLENAFVQSSRGDDNGALRAARAHIETEPESQDRFAVFEDGTSYAGAPGRLDYIVTDFARYAVRIENREPTHFGAHIGFLLTSELLAQPERAYAVELQWRLALPISTLLGAPLALLIGLGNQRGRWYLGLITAVSAWFAYINLLGAGRALLQKEVLPAAIGLWPVHGACLLVLALLLAWHRRVLGWRRAPRQELLRA